ncbi:hypothetical protein [Flexibacterium corallicola]|nr:hypothetical protein [Pseudovibrio sp. M1P-2-3]
MSALVFAALRVIGAFADHENGYQNEPNEVEQRPCQRAFFSVENG